MIKTQCFLLSLLLLSACAHRAKPVASCEPRLRALIDVGSGSTKLNLSEVAICGQDVRLIRVLDDQSSVAVPLEAGKDANGAFTADVQAQGVKAIAELRDRATALAHEKAPNYKSIDFSAVGTQAFRTSTNAQDFADKVNATGIPLVALPQIKEGEFGFLGALRKGLPEACHGKLPVVWDVGGGSQQLTNVRPEGVHVQTLSFGAETFKKKLSELPHKSKCAFAELTPNPIGHKNSTKALKIADEMAKSALNNDFKIDTKKQCVVGIGGVHTKAVTDMIRKLWSHIQNCACKDPLNCWPSESVYNKKEVQCLAHYLSDKSDCDPVLKGPYSTTAVSNLYLILGFMERLKIDQVSSMNVNMGTSMVTDNTALNWRTLSIPEKKP